LPNGLAQLREEILQRKKKPWKPVPIWGGLENKGVRKRSPVPGNLIEGGEINEGASGGH